MEYYRFEKGRCAASINRPLSKNISKDILGACQERSNATLSDITKIFGISQRDQENTGNGYPNGFL